MAAAEILTDETTESEEEFAEYPAISARPVPAGKPYSIAGHAGPDLQAQIRLADWHCQRIAENDVMEAALCDPIVEEIARLQARLEAIRAPYDKQRAWHEAQLKWWVLEENIRETMGKTVPLAHGQIKTLQLEGKTEVVNAAVLTLYQSDPQNYGGLVKQDADSKAVRDRFELLADGTCTDRETGEILPEAVIVQTEEPHVKVTITALGPGRDVAAEE